MKIGQKLLLAALLVLPNKNNALQSKNIHKYMVANYYQFSGQQQKAQQWYEDIFSSSPSPYSLKGYIHLLHDTNQAEKIVTIAQKHTERFSSDPETLLIFATAFKNSGNQQEGDTRIIKLVRAFPSHPEIVFQATNSFLQRKELDNALATIDGYLNNASRRPNNFIFYYLKAQIYAQLKKYPEALQFVRETISAHPQFPQAWLLQATLEEQAGKLQEAISGYSTYMELTGNTNKQIEQHLLQLIMKAKGVTGPNKLFVVNRSCMQEALHLFRRKEYQKALTRIDQCLIKSPKDIEGRLLKVQILTGMGNYKNAVQLLGQWFDANPQEDIWLNTVHLLTRTNSSPAVTELVVTTLSQIQIKNPQLLEPLLYIADLCIRYGADQKARHLLLKAASQTQDPHLKAKILYQAAASAERQTNFDEMKVLLEQAIALDPNYPPALNTLAYYYATKGKNPSKAYGLITQARELDPYNPHFLDTLALVLYKYKKYEPVKILLEKLTAKLPLDYHMHLHLAKVHHKLNNNEKARSYLKHAGSITKRKYHHDTLQKLAKKWRT